MACGFGWSVSGHIIDTKLRRCRDRLFTPHFRSFDFFQEPSRKINEALSYPFITTLLWDWHPPGNQIHLWNVYQNVLPHNSIWMHNVGMCVLRFARRDKLSRCSVTSSFLRTQGIFSKTLISSRVKGVSVDFRISTKFSCFFPFINWYSRERRSFSAPSSDVFPNMSVNINFTAEKLTFPLT